MDGLQNQIVELNQKVDRLHGIVERLSGQLSMLTSDNSQTSQPESESSAANVDRALANSLNKVKYDRFNAVMEHKDVLLDDGNGKNNIISKSEQSLSPDIQIRRLTAQLTAAYNRIAALEEQLLASRVKS